MNAKIAAVKAKKLGLHARQIREQHAKSPEDCALWLGIKVEDYLSLENGSYVPSLPQIESLAYFFNCPFDFFVTGIQNNQKDQEISLQVNNDLITLRNKIVAVSLKKSRAENNLSIEELSAQTDIPVETLKQYEDGPLAIPYTHLRQILEVIGLSTDAFFSQSGPFKHETSQPIQNTNKDLSFLSDEIQSFVAKPANQPYIELAFRLSKMESEKLRSIASSLLEITY